MLISTAFLRGVLGVRGSNPGCVLTKIFSLIFDRETYVIAVLEVTLLLLFFCHVETYVKMPRYAAEGLRKKSEEVLSRKVLRAF